MIAGCVGKPFKGTSMKRSKAERYALGTKSITSLPKICPGVCAPAIAAAAGFA